MYIHGLMWVSVFGSIVNVHSENFLSMKISCYSYLCENQSEKIRFFFNEVVVGVTYVTVC